MLELKILKAKFNKEPVEKLKKAQNNISEAINILRDLENELSATIIASESENKTKD
jgi:hypothetical protein